MTTTMSRAGQPPHPHTRPSLLQRVRDAGDDSAWAEFVGRYGDLILRYCRWRGLQAADADDVRQQVTLKLMRALPGFEYDPGKGRFRDYLGRVVENAIRRHAGGGRKRPDSVGDGLEEIAASGRVDVEERAAREARWEAEWVRHHYRMALDKVRATCEPKSVAMFERLIAGAAADEVANEFGESVQVVYKLKWRLRTRLQEIVELQLRAERLEDG